MTTTWDKLRLEHIGRDADDATSLLDEANLRIAEAARHVADIKNGERASVTLKIDVRRTGADGTVLVRGAVVTRLPARERLGVTGLLADGELVTQAHRQLDVQDVLRAALVEGLGIKPRLAYGPVRVAVSGRKVSPPLFESLELLGRERGLGRLARAAGLAG